MSNVVRLDSRLAGLVELWIFWSRLSSLWYSSRRKPVYCVGGFVCKHSDDEDCIFLSVFQIRDRRTSVLECKRWETKWRMVRRWARTEDQEDGWQHRIQHSSGSENSHGGGGATTKSTKASAYSYLNWLVCLLCLPPLSVQVKCGKVVIFLFWEFGILL